jgi:hypothetical protein
MEETPILTTWCCYDNSAAGLFGEWRFVPDRRGCRSTISDEVRPIGVASDT